MATVRYNAKVIEALADPMPPKWQEEHGVEGQPGLLIVAGRGGARSWHLRYQVRGRRRKMKLGAFPEMGLAVAAKKAERLREELKESGLDPMGEPPEEAGTFGDLCGVYLKSVESGKSRLAPATVAELRRILEGEELKPLRAKPPTEIRDVHIARALDPFEARDAGVMLNRTQWAISTAFTWAVTRHRYGLESNPAAKMPRRFSEVSKERALDAAELKVVWRELGGPHFKARRKTTKGEPRTALLRAALRITLLTGCRPGEVRRMRWEHIEGDTWSMPAGYRKKTKADKGRPSRPHVVHLSAQALAELERVRRWTRGGFLFPAADRKELYKPVSRQTLARVAARMCQRLEVEPWTPHDLRRTARTGWSTVLKVDAVVGEKMLGHALPKILRTYDQSPQLEERRDALDRWGAYLAGLVAGD